MGKGAVISKLIGGRMEHIIYYKHIGKGVLKETKISCCEAIKQTREMARQFAVYIENDQKALEMFMNESHRYNVVLR